MTKRHVAVQVLRPTVAVRIVRGLYVRKRQATRLRIYAIWQETYGNGAVTGMEITVVVQ